MKKSTAEEIIIKSMSVFSKKGLNATMEDIAKGCKVSPGSIYYYFKDKNELLFEAYYYIAQKISEEIGVVIDASKNAEINYKNAAMTAISFIKKNVKMASFYYLVQCANSEKIFKKHQLAKVGNLCPMYKFLEECIKNGDILPIPLVLTIAYYPLYPYVLLNNLMIPTTHEQDKMLVDGLWRAIAPIPS